MKVDALPARTWEWLNVNDIPLPDDGERAEYEYIENKYDIDEGAGQVVIQRFTAGEIQSDTRVVNAYHVGRGGKLRLVQVINVAEGVTLIDECTGICEDEASFELVRIMLGSGRIFTGDRCELKGARSSYACDGAYDISGQGRLDMNYIVDHTGREGNSRINISGALADKASKVFRGTIDFHRGCAGSKGSELEDVLLLNEGVINKTVPLILCDEEDVEGSHGASIGRLDEELQFYLASRALDMDAITEMMVRARIDRVAALIPDESVRLSIIGREE